MSDDWCPENDGAYRMELAARERDTIATLRERLEQAERERDELRDEVVRVCDKYQTANDNGFHSPASSNDKNTNMERVLDEVHQYLLNQYGSSPLGHPIDRERLVRALAGKI